MTKKAYILKVLYKHPLLVECLTLLYNFISRNVTLIYGKSNILQKKGYFKKKTFFKINGSSNQIVIGSKSRLTNTKIKIFGNNNQIIIGENVYLKDTEIYIEDDYNRIYIGENTTIIGKTHLACIEGTKITIGNDCMFSTNIVFRTGDSHSILNKNNERINQSKDISIGNHVWIGNSNMILKGALISDNSIVGANSTITKKFYDTGIIIAGTPATIIKSNISWIRERTNS